MAIVATAQAITIHTMYHAHTVIAAPIVGGLSLSTILGVN